LRTRIFGCKLIGLPSGTRADNGETEINIDAHIAGRRVAWLLSEDWGDDLQICDLHFEELYHSQPRCNDPA
jgi:hypothetical protein